MHVSFTGIERDTLDHALLRVLPSPNHHQFPPQRLNLGVSLASIYRQLNALGLHFRELQAELCILGREGEQEHGIGNGGPPRIRWL